MRPASGNWPIVAYKGRQSTFVGQEIMLKFLRKELLALLAEASAALTVLGQLASEIAMPGWFKDVLIFWRQLLAAAWQPVLQYFSVTPHPHFLAAVSLAVFLVLLGVGARLARSQTRAPLAPLEFRFLEDMSFPSLLVYAGLVYAFLIGSGPDPSKDPPLTLFGNELAGRYTFALILTVGYALGDFIGHKAFHWRLIRIAVLVAVIVACLIVAT